jgi:hypothetical protein
MPIIMFPILIIALIIAIVGLWFLGTRHASKPVGIFAMIIGAIGISVPLFALQSPQPYWRSMDEVNWIVQAPPSGYTMANNGMNITLATFLLSGSIIFGCGAIATAIGTRKG